MIDHKDVHLFLGSLFGSIDLYVCFYDIAMILISMPLFYSLISGSMIPPTLFFFDNIVVAIGDLLWSHINFGIFVLVL